MDNYEKLYKEALERARKLQENSNGMILKKWLWNIFPELAENEDEKSKKWILEYLYDGLRKSDEQFKDQFKAAISWLEKQKSVGEIVERCKNSWYNEGKIAGQSEGMTDDEKYQQGWHDALEKQKTFYSDYEKSELKRGLLWHLKELRDFKFHAKLRLPIKSRATYNDWITWLEKQGKAKTIVCIPKFRIGDVVKFKGFRDEPADDTPLKIVGYDNELYLFDNGTTDLFSEQNLYELVERKQ